jgi:hypothetical protein
MPVMIRTRRPNAAPGNHRIQVRKARVGGWLAASALLAAATTTLAPGTAQAAPAGGTVGDPQPELAQFSVGGVGNSGSGIVLANGNLVLASISKSGTTINVCLLHPGNRKCASTVSLRAHAGDTFFGTPEVLSAGGALVSIVSLDCCAIGSNGAVTFNSTDGGRAFSGEKVAGSITAVGAGTVAGGQLVVASYSASSFNVQAFPPNPSSPVTSLATPSSGIVGASSLTTYKGGVLVANDNTTNTYVEYASSGSNFNKSSSYRHIATIRNEDTVTVSGSALLTNPGGTLTGADELRLFNGKSLGNGHKVPIPKASDDGYWGMQEVRGTVYVFFLNRRASYDVYEESTRNGTTWSALRRFGPAITSAQLVPVLGSSGSGVVFEASSPKLLAQPILNPQSVRITLQHSHVPPGHSTKLTGTAFPHLNHQLVTLQKLTHKRWYTVKTTHESSAGKFAFTVPGVTQTYRVVVAYKPGYYEYGYSRSVTLTA